MACLSYFEKKHILTILKIGSHYLENRSRSPIIKFLWAPPEMNKCVQLYWNSIIFADFRESTTKVGEPKYEPNLSQKFEPNLSMENANSGQQQQQQQHVVGGEGRTGLGEVPPARSMLVAAPENNSISMAMMQWDFQKTQKLMQTIIIMILNTETL